MDIHNTQILNPAEPHDLKHHRVWAKRLCLTKILLAVPLVLCFWASYGVAATSLSLSFVSGLVGLTRLQSEKQLRRSDCCCRGARDGLKGVFVASAVNIVCCILSIVATVFAFLGDSIDAETMTAFGVPCIIILTLLLGVEIATTYQCRALMKIADASDIFNKPDVVIVQTLNPASGALDQFVVELRQQPDVTARQAPYEAKATNVSGNAGGLVTVPEGSATKHAVDGALPPPPGFGVVVTPTEPTQQYGAMHGVVAPIVRHNNVVEIKARMADAKKPPEAQLPAAAVLAAPPPLPPVTNNIINGVAVAPDQQLLHAKHHHHDTSSSSDDDDDGTTATNEHTEGAGAAAATSTAASAEDLSSSAYKVDSPQRIANQSAAAATPTALPADHPVIAAQTEAQAQVAQHSAPPPAPTNGRDTPTPTTVQTMVKGIAEQQQPPQLSSTTTAVQPMTGPPTPQDQLSLSTTPVMTSPTSQGPPSFSTSGAASPTGAQVTTVGGASQLSSVGTPLTPQHQAVSVTSTIVGQQTQQQQMVAQYQQQQPPTVTPVRRTTADDFDDD